jgi:hypothetical protein
MVNAHAVVIVVVILQSGVIGLFALMHKIITSDQKTGEVIKRFPELLHLMNIYDQIRAYLWLGVLCFCEVDMIRICMTSPL